MRCEETHDLLSAYLDQELDVVRHTDMAQHLDTCPQCAHAYTAQQAVQSALRTGSLYMTAPVHLEKRVRSAVRRARKADTRAEEWSWRWLSEWWSWQWLSVGAGLAVVVLLAWQHLPVLTGPGAEESFLQEVVSSHVRSLMANHLTDVASSDQHTVKPWFDHTVDFSPPVIDLTAQGFPLLGGRLDYLGNRPVAALIYQRQQHVINLLLWPAPHDARGGEHTVVRHGYTLLHWTTSGMTYWAISNLNRHELQIFAHVVQQHATLTPSP